MKKYFKYIMLSAVVVAFSSCNKFLDINTNPNSLTQATPALILPQAITGAASISNNFNLSLAEFAGYRANAGGFGGLGAVVTYDFGNGTGANLWTSTYDNANDFQYVIDNTSSDPTLAYSTAIARIMKSFAFERLVNQYNDVPYTDALKGTGALTPKYDKGEDVYKACIAELTLGIANIATAQVSNLTSPVNVNADPLFKGDMESWKRFANTVKLRMLIKMAGVPALKSYADGEFAKVDKTLGFLLDDATNQPGYVKTERPTPIYANLGFSGSGAVISTSRIPSKWIYSFYDGSRLTDFKRGGAIYRAFPNTPKNQLGDESAGVPIALAAGSAWNYGTKDDLNLIGVVKGPAQAQPVMLASEAYFLQAEAYSRGYMVGDAAAAFKNGIEQSFRYLYKDATGTVATTKPGIAATATPIPLNFMTDAADYITENIASPLVNFSLAITTEQKVEAIITQKYIALNMINNDEAWNEFRRTTYPKIINGSPNPLETFASIKSVSTHLDKLPTRFLYPGEENNLNGANVPKDINKFTSLIFWDLN